VTVAYSKAGRDDLAILFAEGAIGTLSDAELLARFARGRGDLSGEAAFAILVDRHGPMVLGVCRRVTGDRHAADDAFQAVFLVLARKAHTVRLGADDSLGRWLYGVSLRVARRARAMATRRPLAARDLDGLDPIDPSSSFDPCERADLRAAIDAEIARLPASYRSAVVLCYLEGLPQKQVARRLRCPVGTVESRLHRARERLRSGLARRGLAPAVGALVGVLERTSRAAVPSHLAKGTAAAVARISAGEALAGVAPVAVAWLAGIYLRNMMIRQCWMIAGLIALGMTTTVGAVGLATAGGDEPKATPSADEPKVVANAVVAAKGERPEPPLAEKLDRLKAEYEAANRAFFAIYRGSTIPEENQAKAAEIEFVRIFPAVVRRIADLAATAPKDPAVRDAMLWMIEKAQNGSETLYPGEFALAASWLVRHHGDDPDSVRVGLELDNSPTANRDDLLLKFYASAKGREPKGLARLALAQYLERKAMMAEGARKVGGRPTYTHDDLVRADGTLYSAKEVMPDQDYAYLLHLKQCDVNYLRAEADRLYEEVIAEYGDVPYITARDRLLETLLKQPEPKWNGQPLTDEGRRRIEAGIARRRSTLGQVAEARLDDWHNLAVGKLAPEINGVDFHRKPLKLSDYRGKVVALVFWGTWCGPCMREIPRETALVERMKGRPFAMLGVNTDDDDGAARKVMEAQGVAWRNWHDGEPGEGPIAKLYHVRGYPTVYVIDAEGKIRAKDAHGGALDQLVEKLVAEKEAAGD
jgi:RNA polymerase sigma factor (sigma-70 family)